MKNIFFLIICLILSVQTFSQWSTDPAENTSIVIASGEQAVPKVATGTDGTSYVSWFSNEGNYNVMLQKLDVFGNKTWADEGLLISDNEAMSWITDWDMAIDQVNNSILTFQDIRTGTNNIYAYRISPDGDFVWGDDGLALSNNDKFEAAPKVCVTNEGNSVFAWQSDSVIIMQKVTPDGTLLWGTDGITLNGDNIYSWPQLIAVGDDEVVIKYYEDSGPSWAPTRYIHAQRFDADGNGVWAQPTAVSNAGGISAWTQVLSFINDGSDGFFIAWHDDRDMNNMSSIFVHHIGNDGIAIFQDNGIEASLNFGMNHFYAYLALPQGSGDIFVYWNEMNGNQDQKGIFGQKISASGERLWTDNGKSILEVSPVNLGPTAACAAEDDMIVFYEEYFDAVNTSIKAMKIDSEGDFAWLEEVVTMSSVQSAKLHPDVGDLHNGQWIAVWGDEKNSNRDIYGQNIKLDGTLGPVSIQGDLEIYPDTVICEEFGPHYVYVENNTLESVTIQYPWFVNSSCEIIYPSQSEFPYVLNASNSLTIEVYVIPGVNILGYVFDYMEIETDASDFEVVFKINEDLLGNLEEQNRNTIQLKAFPNPSSGNVKFDIQSGLNENLALDIYNSLGKIIRSFEIVSNSYKDLEIIWDRRNSFGIEVQPGIYTYRIRNSKVSQSGKIIITR